MFKGNKEIRKVPVRYRKMKLMPTTWRKANRLIKLGKAVLVNDKLLGVYLKLKYKPKTTYTQPMILGIDPGSMFDGYTIVSKGYNRNFQFNHQLSISGSLKGIMGKRVVYRKIRRGRLRNRPMRIEFRTGNKITNTSNYYYQNRVNMINRLLSIYPITHISIEDIRFNHYVSNKGKSFSNIEIGKTRLYDYITKTLKLYLYKVKGSSTKDMREFLFPNLVKNKDKSIRDFNSHCIDSFTIGILAYLDLTEDYRYVSLVPIHSNKVNRSVRFIDRIKYKYKRELHRLKNRIKDSRFYFRYSKGGKKVIIDHKSKLKKIRIKINDTKSNHGKIWNYQYTTIISTYKKFITNYGGTIGKDGISKYWDESNRCYKYYNVLVA